MGIALATALLALFADGSPESAEVKYNVALIAAGASVLVAILAYFSTRLNQRDIEELKNKLAQQAKEQDAQRDYQYEARKRLYSEREPLLFQLAELAENARFRVYSLARTARDGNLPDWLTGDDYYKCSTMYHLIAPLVILRLIQRRLTFVDLTLDRHIAGQYALLKLLYLTFTDAFDFARLAPALEYDPDVADWEKARLANPAKHWRQGLVLGTLDNTIDALLKKEGSPPWMTYGEFEAAFGEPTSPTHGDLLSLADMLEQFHPRARPVLWRMLVTQELIYEKILEGRSGGEGAPARVAWRGVAPAIPAGSLDWRGKPDPSSDDEALRVPLRVAQEYLRTRLPAMFGNPPAPAP